MYYIIDNSKVVTVDDIAGYCGDYVREHNGRYQLMEAGAGPYGWCAAPRWSWDTLAKALEQLIK